MSSIPECFRSRGFRFVTSGVTFFVTAIGVISPLATVIGTAVTVGDIALEVIRSFKNNIPIRRHLHVKAALCSSIALIVSIVKLQSDYQFVTSVGELAYHFSIKGAALGSAVAVFSLFSRVFYLLGYGDLSSDSDEEAGLRLLALHARDEQYIAVQDKLFSLQHRFLFLFTKLKMAAKCRTEIETELEVVLSELYEVEQELAEYTEYKDVGSMFVGEQLEELIFIKFLFTKYFLEYIEKQLDKSYKIRDDIRLDKSLSLEEKQHLLDEITKKLDSLRDIFVKYGLVYDDFFARICDKYGLPQDSSDLETRRAVLQASLVFLNTRLQGDLGVIRGEWFSVVACLLHSEIQDL